MAIVLTVLHVIICFFLVIVVLLQSGKAADLAGAFGGMGSQTAFGPRGGATLLSRATTVAAALFMVTSLTLAILATRGGGTGKPSTILEQQKTQTQQKAPVVPSGPGTSIPNGRPTITLTPEGGGKPITVPVPATPPAAGQKPGTPVPAKK